MNGACIDSVNYECHIDCLLYEEVGKTWPCSKKNSPHIQTKYEATWKQKLTNLTYFIDCYKTMQTANVSIAWKFALASNDHTVCTDGECAWMSLCKKSSSLTNTVHTVSFPFPFRLLTFFFSPLCTIMKLSHAIVYLRLWKKQLLKYDQKKDKNYYRCDGLHHSPTYIYLFQAPKTARICRMKCLKNVRQK